MTNTFSRRKHIATKLFDELPDEDHPFLHRYGSATFGQRDQVSTSSKIPFNLMEQVFLLGLKDCSGFTSFWNSSISIGLRACALMELALRGKIKLEPSSRRRKILSTRKLIVNCEEDNQLVIGDVFLDETLKLIKDSGQSETISDWIAILSGEVWNPIKLRYQLKNVRERLAKNLVEKGVLTTEKRNLVVVVLTTHPLIDNETKSNVIKSIQATLLSKWCGDPRFIEQRMLALIVLAKASDVINNALMSLDDEKYELACSRLGKILAIDFEQEARENPDNEVFWAVLASLDL